MRRRNAALTWCYCMVEERSPFFLLFIFIIFFFLNSCRQIHHVRFCRTCQRAQRGFELLRSALWASSFATLLGLALASVAAAAGKVAVTAWAAAAVAVTAGALAAAADRVNAFIDKGFHFQDFVHALND